jgi:hypothetical protein
MEKKKNSNFVTSIIQQKSYDDEIDDCNNIIILSLSVNSSISSKTILVLQLIIV